MAYLKLFMTATYWYVSIKAIVKLINNISKKDKKGAVATVSESFIDYSVLTFLDKFIL